MEEKKCKYCGTSENLKKRIYFGQERIQEVCQECYSKNMKEKLAKKSKEEKEEMQRKREATKEKNFGSKTYNNAQKRKETIEIRYGVDEIFKMDSFKNDKNIRNKIRATNKERYGADHFLKSTEGKEKIKQTVREKYGVDNVFQLEEIKLKSKETAIERYGDIPIRIDEIKNKIKETNKERYGVECLLEKESIRNLGRIVIQEKFNGYHPMQTEEVNTRMQANYKKTRDKKYGGKYPIQVDSEITNKIINTKRQNGTFNSSQGEETAYEILSRNYQVIRQYKDPRYPFACDFYLPEFDCFIEYNEGWQHGGMPYDHTNPICIELRTRWEAKAQTSDYFKNSLKTWMIRDPNKRNIAQTNGLNYIELWSEEEVLKFAKEPLSYSYPMEECKIEFKTLTTSPGNYNSRPNHNKIINTFQPHFYEIENEIWKNPVTKIKLLNNRVKYLGKNIKDISEREILRGFKISGIHNGFSHFASLWIKKFIEDYNISSIYDPCGGWGHRLIGASNIKYIYNDIDERTCNGVKNMIEAFDMKDKTVYNNDASEFTPEENYDAVYTCPPYFTIENYNHVNTSTEKYPSYFEWINIWWREVVRHSVKPSTKYFSFVISEKMITDLKIVCVEEGLKFEKEILIGADTKSHFQKDMVMNKCEYLVIFRNF